MTKKSLAALALALVLALPSGAYAAVDHAIVFTLGDGGNVGLVQGAYMDGNTYVGAISAIFPLSGINSTQDLSEAAVDSILTEASGFGYTGITANTVTWPALSPEETQALIDESLPDSFLKAAAFTGTVAGGSGAVSIDVSSLECSSVASVIWESNDDTKLYSFGSKSAATSTVSSVAKVQSFTSGNALLNLIGGLVGVLTGVSQTNAPNGTSVNATVLCS